VDLTKAKIEKYRELNHELIIKNRSLKLKEEEKEKEKINEEIPEEAIYDDRERTTVNLKRPSRRKKEEEIPTNTLAVSSSPAILGIINPQPKGYTPVAALPTFIQPQPTKLLQKAVTVSPEQKLLEMKAAGYTDEFSRKRALEEAFGCLTFSNDKKIL